MIEPESVALTVRRGVLHRYPAFEACNLDDGEYHIILTGADEARRSPSYRRDCRRCSRFLRKEEIT